MSEPNFKTYKRRPEHVEAVRYEPGMTLDCIYTDPMSLVGIPGASMADQMLIRECGAVLRDAYKFHGLRPGDYIVIEAQSIKHVLSPDEFQARYEPI